MFAYFSFIIVPNSVKLLFFKSLFNVHLLLTTKIKIEAVILESFE